jgi:hypothetical protein
VAEIKDLARTERAYAAIASMATEEQRNIQYQIKEKMREKGLRQIKEPDIVVTWYPIKPRVTFDMEALRTAADKVKFNLTPFEKVGDPSDGLRLSVSDLPKPTAKQKGKK